MGARAALDTNIFMQQLMSDNYFFLLKGFVLQIEYISELRIHTRYNDCRVACRFSCVSRGSCFEVIKLVVK